MKMGPHAESRLAQLVRQRVDRLQSRKKQNEIAREAGFLNANMVSIIKNGHSKLALDRVPAMAAALECDPGLLLRLAFEQAGLETAASTMEDVLNTIVSSNELQWLEVIRDASDNCDPPLTKRARSAMLDIFGK